MVFFIYKVARSYNWRCYKYGTGTAEEMQYKSRQIKKFSRIDYEDKISYYKDAVKNLKKEKGIE